MEEPDGPEEHANGQPARPMTKEVYEEERKKRNNMNKELSRRWQQHVLDHSGPLRNARDYEQMLPVELTWLGHLRTKTVSKITWNDACLPDPEILLHLHIDDRVQTICPVKHFAACKLPHGGQEHTMAPYLAFALRSDYPHQWKEHEPGQFEPSTSIEEEISWIRLEFSSSGFAYRALANLIALLDYCLDAGKTKIRHWRHVDFFEFSDIHQPRIRQAGSKPLVVRSRPKSLGSDQMSVSQTYTSTPQISTHSVDSQQPTLVASTSQLKVANAPKQQADTSGSTSISNSSVAATGPTLGTFSPKGKQPEAVSKKKVKEVTKPKRGTSGFMQSTKSKSQQAVSLVLLLQEFQRKESLSRKGRKLVDALSQCCSDSIKARYDAIVADVASGEIRLHNYDNAMVALLRSRLSEVDSEHSDYGDLLSLLVWHQHLTSANGSLVGISEPDADCSALAEVDRIYLNRTAMKGHLLDEGQFVRLYDKKRPSVPKIACIQSLFRLPDTSKIYLSVRPCVRSNEMLHPPGSMFYTNELHFTNQLVMVSVSAEDYLDTVFVMHEEDYKRTRPYSTWTAAKEVLTYIMRTSYNEEKGKLSKIKHKHWRLWLFEDDENQEIRLAPTWPSPGPPSAALVDLGETRTETFSKKRPYRDAENDGEVEESKTKKRKQDILDAEASSSNAQPEVESPDAANPVIDQQEVSTPLFEQQQSATHENSLLQPDTPLPGSPTSTAASGIIQSPPRMNSLQTATASGIPQAAISSTPHEAETKRCTGCRQSAKPNELKWDALCSSCVNRFENFFILIPAKEGQQSALQQFRELTC